MSRGLGFPLDVKLSYGGSCYVEGGSLALP